MALGEEEPCTERSLQQLGEVSFRTVWVRENKRRRGLGVSYMLLYAASRGLG